VQRRMSLSIVISAQQTVPLFQKSTCFLPVMPDLMRHPETEHLEKVLDSGSSPERQVSNTCSFVNGDPTAQAGIQNPSGRCIKEYLTLVK
jgi:hypothetical protein